jgi:3-hydroxyisobutyrate dehydrogenase-like beta-hydroxyacid dehydrogenase
VYSHFSLSVGLVNVGHTGTATKLVNQLLVGAHAAASAEALRLAKQLGVTDVDLLLSVLDKSWGQSRVLARCGTFISEVSTAVCLACSCHLYHTVPAVYGYDVDRQPVLSTRVG